jgi:hypothetical protein
VFIVGGALPIIVLCWRGLRNVLREKPSSPDAVLFIEPVITAPTAREVEV